MASWPEPSGQSLRLAQMRNLVGPVLALAVLGPVDCGQNSLPFSPIRVTNGMTAVGPAKRQNRPDGLSPFHDQSHITVLSDKSHPRAHFSSLKVCALSRKTLFIILGRQSVFLRAHFW